MLRITPLAGTGRVKDYFTESLSRGDYYLNKQELAGVWGGKQAAQFDLTGAVEKKEFFRLCENRHPGTGKPLTARTLSNRRVGYDVNFHPPKSVSMQGCVYGDKEILTGFEEAADYTMQIIESNSQARVRKGGADFDRTTGNLVWSKFTHMTARPVGGIPDPHIHSHVVVQNVTYDPVEECHKAIQFGNIKREAGYYEAIFNNRLRQNMEQIGYRTRTTKEGKSFELEHISDEMISTFSRRTRNIEAIAKEKGIVNVAQKSELGSRTREKKNNVYTMDELKTIWRSRLTPQQLEQLSKGKSEPQSKSAMLKRGGPIARQAIEFATEHCFERDSVVREKALLQTAFKHAQGKASCEQLVEQLETLGLISKKVGGIQYLTTKAMLAEEQSLVDFARAGIGKYAPFSQVEDFSKTRLSSPQAFAARSILASEDQVSVLRGVAGTGKTFLMQNVIEEIEHSQRKKVWVTATTIDSSDMLKKEGFADAQTIQRLLVNKSIHPQLKDGTIWVDEIGLVGTRTMGEIFAFAKRNNTRLILTGDEAQHASVLRGSPLKLLRENGIAPVELTEIRRQTGEYKQIVQKLSQGKYSSAFRDLDRLGWVVEKDRDDAHQAIAEEIRRAVVGKKSSMKSRPLVISPTHVEKNQLTEVIRAELFKAKWLSGTERTYICLESLGLTEAQRKVSNAYQEGSVVCFYQNMNGFKAGSRAEVESVDERGDVWLNRPGQHQYALNLEQADRFDVFTHVERKLAIGDPIRITGKGKTKLGNHALRSGSEYEVRGFDGEDIVLMNNWIVKKDFKLWDVGYVKTSNSSQGANARKVLIAQQANSLANNAKGFLVSVSRGSQEARIYTNDKRRLFSEIQNNEKFPNATDIGPDKEQHLTRQRENDDERKRKEQEREPGL